MSQSVDISVIIPIFNEEDNLNELFKQLSAVFGKIRKDYEIIFINDGSKDRSECILDDLHHKNSKIVKVINFTRNFGHQMALTAGLNYAKGRAVVIMDADLQDPPELIVDFIKKWDEGFEVVYGLRTKREGETFFKKFTAHLFYKLIRRITNVDIPENVGDFYLLDRKVVDFLKRIDERHRFLRGLVAWSGFKSVKVEYVRKSRQAGSTKYPFWKMVKFSFDAITSFSFAPLRFVSALGAIFSIISFVAILFIIYIKFFVPQAVLGWSSIMAVILFIGGIQLLAIGTIGEYIARIGDDVRHRPLYAVKEILE